MKKVLYLTLKREYFDEIVNGTKREEYRDIKPFFRSRIQGREYDEIEFRNGRSKNVPIMRVEYKG